MSWRVGCDVLSSALVERKKMMAGEAYSQLNPLARGRVWCSTLSVGDGRRWGAIAVYC